MPGDIEVKRGETIRFVICNDGVLMHEMVIGTMKGLEEHAGAHGGRHGREDRRQMRRSK